MGTQDMRDEQMVKDAGDCSCCVDAATEVEASARKPPKPSRWDGGRSGRPAPAFDEAALGARGWGIRPADVAVIVATVAAALAVCCVLWFAYGVQGLPGISTGEDQVVGDAPASSAVPAGTDAGSSSVTPSAQAQDDAAQPLYAVIQNSDGFYQVLPLAEDARVTVESSLGTNVIEVADGRVRCLESDCSNQTCVRQGWVSGQGQTIVCLPHKLTVQVVADPEDASPLR